jgi:hypothetical protein
MLKQLNRLKTGIASKQTEQALLSCLKEVPFLRAKKIQAETKKNVPRPDLVIQCQGGQNEKTLIVEARENGQPKPAREAINQLLLYLNAIPDSYGIFLAPFISPQTAALCMQNRIGYLDLAGNCFLQFDQVFIKKEGNPNPFSEKRDLRSLYSPKAERALRVLLNTPKRNWKVQELALQAKISLGQAHNVKKLLSDREWLKTSKDGFSLIEPRSLLPEWSKNYNFRRNEVSDFYSPMSLPDLESEITRVCEAKKLDYAFTGFSAAARLVSLGRYQRATVYFETNDLESIAQSLELKKVKSGPNLTILSPYDSGVFYGRRSEDDILIVSPIQIYLDLLGFRGRGEEAANLILEKHIELLW